MYQEIKPSKGIDNVIDTFWTFSKNKSNENFKVLPDTCADLIFDLKQNKGFLSGIMNNYQFRELTTESNLIGVRFKIEKFGFLSQTPLDVTKNLRVDLSEILPSKNLVALNRLSELGKKTDKIDLLEKFIESAFKQNLQNQDQIVLSVAEKIRSLQ